MTDVIHGVETWHETLGRGPRPALAIHCAMGNARVWDPIFAPLADRLSVTVFDLPGHGRSAPWVRDDTPGAYQKLATQIAANFIRYPVDLVAHSFGTGMALRIAVAAPQAIRSLTLIEPLQFKAIAGSEEYRAVSAECDQIESLIAVGKEDKAARSFLDTWGEEGMWDEMDAAQRARRIEQLPIVVQAGRANLEDPGDTLRPGALEEIEAPVLLIHGEDSPAAVARTCSALADRFQDVGTAIVPGAGHMLPLTHPEIITELIEMNIERG